MVLVGGEATKLIRQINFFKKEKYQKSQITKISSGFIYYRPHIKKNLKLLCTNVWQQMCNLDEIGMVLETHQLLRLTQEEIGNLNIPVARKYFNQ